MRIAATTLLLALTAVPSASAAFHLMQIEQVIGGIEGDTTAQAIQLRLRGSFQCFLANGAQLRVHDATGANPVVLVDFDQNVSGCAFGDRVLITSKNFNRAVRQRVTADFTLTNLIPESYLAAGSLTFEDGTAVVWRLSWGGDEYTGPTTGTTVNDPDGEFGPPVPEPLPTEARRALRFTGPAGAPSDNNINDYALTDTEATLINNTCETFRLGAPCPWDCFCPADNLVDQFDLVQSITEWGQVGGRCDMTGDGTSTADLLAILANWGGCS